MKFDAGADLGMGGLSLTTANSPASVTIDGGGRVVDLTGSPSGSPLITVGSGVTLTLKNITFKGLRGSQYTATLPNADNSGTVNVTYPAAEAGDTSDNTASVILVNSGGTLVMEDGAHILNNSRTGGNGGGVYIGMDWIKAGSASFTMTGGYIQNNRTAVQGGGVIVYSGTYDKKGGTIYGNDADASLKNFAGVT